MKHKAQESLNHILYCDRDKPHSYISDAYRNDFSELGKLINCQLTPKEVEYIQMLISLEVYITKDGHTAFEKLEKQKEMWEEE